MIAGNRILIGVFIELYLIGFVRVGQSIKVGSLILRMTNGIYLCHFVLEVMRTTVGYHSKGGKDGRTRIRLRSENC